LNNTVDNGNDCLADQLLPFSTVLFNMVWATKFPSR